MGKRRRAGNLGGKYVQTFFAKINYVLFVILLALVFISYD